MHAQLREDVLRVMPHGVWTDAKLLGDFAVRGPPREQARNLRFAAGQTDARLGAGFTS